MKSSAIYLSNGVFLTTLCYTEARYTKESTDRNRLAEFDDPAILPDYFRNGHLSGSRYPKTTIFHYVGGKEDVLESLIETLMQQCFQEIVFDIRLGREHMEKVFVKVFRFWNGENRKKLDTLIKNGLDSRLLTWASQRVQQEQIGAMRKSDLDPKLLEIGLMVGITNFFSLLFYWSRDNYRESAEQMAKYAVWVLPHAFYNPSAPSRSIILLLQRGLILIKTNGQLLRP